MRLRGVVIRLDVEWKMNGSIQCRKNFSLKNFYWDFVKKSLDVFASKKSYPESNPGKIYIKRNVM